MVIAVITLALTIWVYSMLNGKKGHGSDPSVVDKTWSILPPVYVWILYLKGGPNPRLLAMALLATAWGARLTYNFAIKGGYSGGEDYRWAEVRKWFPGWQFEVFNLFFICLYQQLLILGFTAPAVVAFQASTAPTRSFAW